MTSRREFLKMLGSGTAGLYLTSIAAVSVLSGCDSSDGATLSNLMNWDDIRKNEFKLNKSNIYMNNSTLGPTLRLVSGKMAAIQEMFSAGMPVWDFVQDIVFAISPIRDRFTNLVNAHTDAGGRSSYVGIVESVTDGMSLVANGITFSPGDGILITDHEHTGGKTMWELQRDRYGAELYEVPLIVDSEPEEEWEEALVARFEDYLTSHDIKVVSFSYITTSTGHILPVKRLCRLARDYGAISVVDAAQAFAVVPIDVTDVGCDFLVVNGHKYLCGPPGSGFICIHPGMLETPGSFWPTIVDENYYNPGNPARSNPIRKGGMKPFTNILPLAETLEFYRWLGPQTVYERLLSIGRWLRTGLSRYPEAIEVITPSAEGLSCSMTCFRIKGMDSERVADTLFTDYNIITKHATEGDADAVRLSPHYYIKKEELNRTARAICSIAGVDSNAWFEGNELD